MTPINQKRYNSALLELKITTALSPISGVPGVHDSFTFQNSVYLVMERVHGKSISQLIKDGHTFSTRDALMITYAVLTILADVHRAKVCHHDVSYGNVMFEKRTGAVNLIDFGLAAHTTTLDGKCGRGTCGFKAPETVLKIPGTKIHDGKVDVFAAGCLLYLLLTGKRFITQKLVEKAETLEFMKSPKDFLWGQTPLDVDAEHRKIVEMLMDPNQETRPTASEALRQFAVLARNKRQNAA